MESAAAAILILSAILLSTHAADQSIITSPQPGQEYVFVQTHGSGARPISRKDKLADPERPFETAHKLPKSLTYALKESQRPKREASPADAPAPAPAGAIKLDPLKLLERYKADLKTSTTEAPKSTTVKGTRKSVTRGKQENRRRAKKAAPVTDPTPVLTTGRSAPRVIDDDVPLLASGSEKQRSRIQIKKGPNGQEYEYEYVYYYYDEDVDDKPVQQKTTNSHDGPLRGKSTPEPTANEIVPSRSTHARGRQLDTEDPVGEERLPANTRFPPRSRNLATTPLPEEEKTTRGRNRGRPTTEAAIAAETDNNSEESQGSRGRTRSNVRRPSLDLVDSASFNTHSGTAGSEVQAGGPSFPQDLPAGPVRFLGATPHEKPQDADGVQEKGGQEEKAESTPLDGATEAGETTTVMSPMDKVALDLYAISQGTQKLSGEDAEANAEEGSTGATDEDTATTFEPTTLAPTTEYTTPSTTTPTTTTTRTTTTTPTTTTTTTEAPLKRFGNRGRIGGRKTTTTSATPTTEANSETKPKKFGGRFGSRPRPGTRTTAEPAVEEEATKEESKPSFSKPSASRPRFGSNRNRARTTAAPSEAGEGKEEAHPSSTSAPSFRPRPRLPLGGSRGRPRTTAAPAEDKSEGSDDSAAASSVSSEVSSTTQRSRGRIALSSGASRPALRPGPRINLARGRPGVSSTTTTEAAPVSEESAEEKEETQQTEKVEKEPEATSTTAQDNNPLNRLRNKNRLNVTPASRPKAAASSPVQVRRINPLLSRRKPGASEPSTSEAPQEEPATEEETSEQEESGETPAPSSSTTTTTEEPRGLSKLLAGRRRLAARQPGTIN